MTATTSLPGARGALGRSAASAAGLEYETIAHISELYGSRETEVFQLAASAERLRELLSPYALDVAAPVIFAARAEQCVRLVDFLLRRTLPGFSRDQGQSAVDPVASLLAEEFEWSPGRTTAEISLYQNYATQAFRDDASTPNLSE
jgi:glycerol-3-phosphate dehydrogenase